MGSRGAVAEKREVGEETEFEERREADCARSIFLEMWRGRSFCVCRNRQTRSMYSVVGDSSSNFIFFSFFFFLFWMGGEDSFLCPINEDEDENERGGVKNNEVDANFETG